MAEKKDNTRNQENQNVNRSNPNQAGEDGQEIEGHDIGAENINLSDEEVERQEEWNNNPDSREYFGPKTVSEDEVSPK